MTHRFIDAVRSVLLTGHRPASRTDDDRPGRSMPSMSGIVEHALESFHGRHTRRLRRELDRRADILARGDEPNDTTRLRVLLDRRVDLTDPSLAQRAAADNDIAAVAMLAQHGAALSTADGRPTVSAERLAATAGGRAHLRESSMGRGAQHIESFIEANRTGFLSGGTRTPYVTNLEQPPALPPRPASSSAAAPAPVDLTIASMIEDGLDPYELMPSDPTTPIDPALLTQIAPSGKGRTFLLINKLVTPEQLVVDHGVSDFDAAVSASLAVVHTVGAPQRQPPSPPSVYSASVYSDESSPDEDWDRSDTDSTRAPSTPATPVHEPLSCDDLFDDIDKACGLGGSWGNLPPMTKSMYLRPEPLQVPPRNPLRK